MKLYATTTSERASKGQGGNKDILIVLIAEIDGQRQEIASMSAIVGISNYQIDIKAPDGNKYNYFVSKGKSQKGEHCRKCEEYHNDGIYHICPDNQ